MMVEIKTYPDASSLARAAAEQWVALAQAGIADHGRFSVALSGGSTPRTLYALLATKEFAARVEWSHVHVFWGDERCVPPDHLESNYRMARETLLDHVPVPPSNVHRIPSEQAPERAAAAYERTLRALFVGHAGRYPTPLPCFDLVLLGMGDDGHTASLFPGSAALYEQTRWVAANYVDKLGAWRVTLTPIAINAAAHVTFLVSGAGKAERLREVLSGPYQLDVLPAQIIRPTSGGLVWLVDAAAVAIQTSAGLGALGF
jgi:6-phosphogluconolactonase